MGYVQPMQHTVTFTGIYWVFILLFNEITNINQKQYFASNSLK